MINSTSVMAQTARIGPGPPSRVGGVVATISVRGEHSAAPLDLPDQDPVLVAFILRMESQPVSAFPEEASDVFQAGPVREHWTRRS